MHSVDEVVENYTRVIRLAAVGRYQRHFDSRTSAPIIAPNPMAKFQ
jgi:hypothetical protein